MFGARVLFFPSTFGREGSRSGNREKGRGSHVVLSSSPPVMWLSVFLCLLLYLVQLGALLHPDPIVLQQCHYSISPSRSLSNLLSPSIPL